MTFRSRDQRLICPACGGPVPDDSPWFVPQTGKFACCEDCARHNAGLPTRYSH